MIVHRRVAIVCWPLAAALFVTVGLLPREDLSPWLARLAGVLVLMPILVARWPPFVRAATELFRAIDVRDFATSAGLAPLVGIVLNTWINADPAGTTYYETTAQVGAGLLIAYAVEGGRRMSGGSDPRGARGLHVGLAMGVIVALAASLDAVGRADGSWFLCAMTLGGLVCGAVFFIAATVPGSGSDGVAAEK